MKTDKNKTIPLAGGKTLELTAEQYEAVAELVRKEDRLQHATSVLQNNLSCTDSRLKNLEEFIISSEAKLDSFAEALYDKLESDQGEKEYFAVAELIEQCGFAVYRIISNKGTDDEQDDEAILPNELAEMLTAQDDLTIWSTDGDYLDSAYIDEIEYVGPYEK